MELLKGWGSGYVPVLHVYLERVLGIIRFDILGAVDGSTSSDQM